MLLYVCKSIFLTIIVVHSCIVVAGCPKLQAPTNGWIKRDGRKAVVGCNGSERSWEVTCDGKKWTDVSEECPEGKYHKHTLPTNNVT